MADLSTLSSVVDMSALRVGVVYWQHGDGIASPISGILEELGCEVVNFLHDARLPEDLDVVLAYSPFGSLVPLANQLLACSPSRRPLFVLWQIEQLPNPHLPEWVRYVVGIIRSRAERLAFRRKPR